MGMTHRTAGVLKYHLVINWKDMGGTIPVDRNTSKVPPITTTQFWTGTGPSVSQISKGRYNIEGTRRFIISQEVSNTEPLDDSINIIPAKQQDSTPS